MKKAISSSEAREQFPEILNQVTYAKDRFIIKKRGKAVAAVVAMEDLVALEAYEDERDSRLLEFAINASKGTIPFTQVIEQYQKKHTVSLEDIDDEQ